MRKYSVMSSMVRDSMNPGGRITGDSKVNMQHSITVKRNLPKINQLIPGYSFYEKKINSGWKQLQRSGITAFPVERLCGKIPPSFRGGGGGAESRSPASSPGPRGGPERNEG